LSFFTVSVNLELLCNLLRQVAQKVFFLLSKVDFHPSKQFFEASKLKACMFFQMAGISNSSWNVVFTRTSPLVSFLSKIEKNTQGWKGRYSLSRAALVPLFEDKGIVRVLSAMTTIECGFNAMFHSTVRQVFSKLL
jgi:hypothetical protein